nr:hypothetical protein Iba_chr10dCG11700 [Ipomoea batatas]
MMQPYEEEITEDMKNKILAMMEELKQDMANMREEWKQEFRQRTSSLGQETQASIRTLEDQLAQVAKCGNEEEDTHGHFFNPCDFNDSDSFDSSDDDENCFDTCENNSFNSTENNSIESCEDNFSNPYDSNSSNPRANNSLVSLDDNDGLESFTFGDSSLSNEHVDDLHEMLCGDDDMNIDASLCDLIDIEFVTFHDNCLDDALCIHDLIAFCLSSISLPEVAVEINVVRRCANYCLSRCRDEALLRQLEAVRPCCKSEQLESIGGTATEQLCYCGTLLRKTALRLAEECLLWKD